MGLMESTELIGLRITPTYHQKLRQLALNRSAEIGCRVSMGFIIQELIDERLQMENQETRSAQLFGSPE